MKKQAIATGFIFFSFMLPLKAAAATFSQLFVFGDSLSDTGNLFNASGETAPPENLGYFNGRVSNGPNWIDYLAQDLNLSTPTPVLDVLDGISPTDGINFAFSGATSETANTIDSQLPGLQQQIGLSTIAPSDPNALYIVWIGANDYLPTTSPSFTPFTSPQTTVANIAGAVTALAGVGAKNIIVANLPNLGQTPIANGLNPFSPIPVPPDTSTRLNDLTEAHNALLATTLDSLDASLKSQNVNLISLDINSLFQEVTNPATSPFTNVTDPCILNLSCTDPNQFLFWDGSHPTTAGHKLIGEFAFDRLQGNGVQSVPEPASIVGLLTIGAMGVGATLKKGRE